MKVAPDLRDRLRDSVTLLTVQRALDELRSGRAFRAEQILSDEAARIACKYIEPEDAA